MNQLAVIPRQRLALSSEIYALLDDWHTALDLMVRAGRIADTTAVTYKRGTSKFVEWCEGQPAVSPEIILEWIAFLREKDLTSATINTWLAGVRSFFAWAKRTHRIDKNPLDDLMPPKRIGLHERHKREPLSDAEVLRVLSMPNDTPSGLRDRAILYLKAYGALRDVEIHRANLGDLRTESGHPVLHVQGKGQHEANQVVVLSNEEETMVLGAYLKVRGAQPGALFVSFSDRSKGKRLSLRAIRGLVMRYFTLAEVKGENKTSHSLRHSAITNAIRNGAPVNKTQSMARHADISTTMIYYHELDRLEKPAEAFIRYEDSNGKLEPTNESSE